MSYSSIKGRFLGYHTKDGTVSAPKGVRSEVTTASTGTTITAGGMHTFSTTSAKSYTLAAPVPGLRKTLFCTLGTTDNTHTLTIASGTIQSTATSTGTIITLKNSGDCVELVGRSTSAYALVNNQGTATLA